MTKRLRSAWWSIQLPAESEVESDPECVTINLPATSGVLQISASRKADGKVEEADLLDFAADDLAEVDAPEPVSFPNFSGLALTLQREELFLRKWWLASGRLLVLATYTSESPLLPAELEQVGALLGTLEPRT